MRKLVSEQVAMTPAARSNADLAEPGPRCGAIARRIAAVDDGKRHSRPVGSDGMQALADVLRWIVAAKNGLLFLKGSFPSANVVVKDGAGSDERFILEPQVGSAKRRVLSDRSVVRRLGKFNAMRCSKSAGGVRGQIHDPKIG